MPCHALDELICSFMGIIRKCSFVDVNFIIKIISFLNRIFSVIIRYKSRWYILLLLLQVAAKWETSEMGNIVCNWGSVHVVLVDCNLYNTCIPFCAMDMDMDEDFRYTFQCVQNYDIVRHVSMQIAIWVDSYQIILCISEEIMMSNNLMPICISLGKNKEERVMNVKKSLPQSWRKFNMNLFIIKQISAFEVRNRFDRG